MPLVSTTLPDDLLAIIAEARPGQSRSAAMRSLIIDALRIKHKARIPGEYGNIARGRPTGEKSKRDRRRDALDILRQELEQEEAARKSWEVTE